MTFQSVSDTGGRMAMCAFNKYSWKSSHRQQLILTGSLRKLSQSWIDVEHERVNQKDTKINFDLNSTQTKEWR